MKARFCPPLLPSGRQTLSSISLAAAIGGSLALLGAPADARITNINIISRTVDFGGRVFGQVGAYEDIRGTATGELDPGLSQNAVITDINLAERTNGKVQYTTTFTLRKPVDMTKASGVLAYEVNNRGRELLPDYLNEDVSAGNPAGDGFLYNTGNVFLWSGWEADLPFDPSTSTEAIQVPIAKNADGSTIVGPNLVRYISVQGNVNTQPLPPPNVPATLDTTTATLISIAHESNTGVQTGVVNIPSSDWAFADCSSTPFPGVPDPTHVCLKNGFDPNLIYQLVYQAKDPLVQGIGFAATRDIVSFFRRAMYDDAGTPNPIASTTRWSIGYGKSQSGRFLKEFLLLGFNEDEDGKIVWDGADNNIGMTLGQFNVRFSHATSLAANIYEPGSEGPLWWADYDDTTRGRGVTGILDRCEASGTCPKIFEDFGGAEIWYMRAGVAIAGTTGNHDITVPRNVRRYYYASTKHSGGNGGFSIAQPPSPGMAFASNPNPEKETSRALWVALTDWVTRGIQPPQSSYPRVSDGTLVPATAQAMGWPDIPGAPTPDNVMNVLLDFDYGPEFRYNDDSGVMTKVPPTIKQIITTLAEKVDADGNDVAGIKSVLLQAPLGTYTSWNPYSGGPLAGNEVPLAGGYIPFPVTKADRVASGDPRLSIEERYGTQGGYVCAVQRAAFDLVTHRYLLPQDADRLIAQAAASNVLPSLSSNSDDNKTAHRLCARAHAGQN